MQYWLFSRTGTINLAVEPAVRRKAGQGDRVYFLDDDGRVSLWGVVLHRERKRPKSSTLRVRCFELEPSERISARRLRGLIDRSPGDAIETIPVAAARRLQEIVGPIPKQRSSSSRGAKEQDDPDAQAAAAEPGSEPSRGLLGKTWQGLSELPTTIRELPTALLRQFRDEPAGGEVRQAWLVPAGCRLEQRVRASNYRRIEPGARVLWQQRDPQSDGGWVARDWGTVLAKQSWGGKRREYRVLVTQLPLEEPISLPLVGPVEPVEGEAGGESDAGGGGETGAEPEAGREIRERRLSEAEARALRRSTTGMPSSFEEAFREELDLVAKLRGRRGYDARWVAEPVVYHQAHRAELAGLAFSGGGIRSATFNLGVLQALAEPERGLLRGFDYLSTVSGGGYIGSWLVAWIKRRGLVEVEERLPREHPEVRRDRHLASRERRLPLTPVTYLRRYSNFLTPRVGLFGADSWTVLATYARNLLLNLLILVTALSALLLVPRIVVTASRLVLGGKHGLDLTVALMLGFLLIGLFGLFRNVRSLSDFLGGARRSAGAAEDAGQMNTARVQLLVLLPLLSAALAGAYCIWLWSAERIGEVAGEIGGPWTARALSLASGWLPGAAAEPPELLAWLWRMLDSELILWMLGAALLYLGLWLPVAMADTLGFFRRGFQDWGKALRGSWNVSTLLGMAFLSGLGGGALLRWFSDVLWLLGGSVDPVTLFRESLSLHFGAAVGAVSVPVRWPGFPLLVTWGPPLMVLVMVVTAALHIGLMGRAFAEDHRQWWSRLGAWMLLASAGWIGLFGISLYGPLALAWLADRGAAAAGTISLGWVASTLAGLWAARSSDTGEGRPGWLGLLAGITPYLFVFGLLALLATAIQATIAGILGSASNAESLLQSHLATTWGAPDLGLGWLLLAAVVLAGASLWLSWRIDINEFSMHLFYRSRLVRAYLGASRQRRPHPFTGFDHEDDLELSSILDHWPIVWKVPAGGRGVDGELRLLDETRRRGGRAWIDCKTPEAVAKAISRLMEPKAPAIGPTAAYGLVVGLRTAEPEEDLSERFEKVVKLLSDARPESEEEELPQTLQRGRERFRSERSARDRQLVAALVDWAHQEAASVTSADGPTPAYGLVVGLLTAEPEQDLSRRFEKRLERLGAARPQSTVRQRVLARGREFFYREKSRLDRQLVAALLEWAHQEAGGAASSGAVAAIGGGPDRRNYAGPVPILNTALNLSAGGDLAQQERKASSFFFTPLHYGFDTGVEPATETDRKRLLLDKEPFAVRYTAAANGGDGISLGMAMTVSGAAVSPNMGYHSSAPLAFLLTVFNARLGLWLGNPRRNATWQIGGPSIGLIYLLAELFGQTREDSRYVSLADGGFFDNLGIYELVRRRCRYIVACDAEADPELEFSGLSNAIRKCRSDFGVEIDIDIEPIRAGAGGLSERHCAVGKIHYPDEGASPGVLVYLKASLTGDEPEDVTGYHAAHEGFPHESTGDQWFDESQFESYRVLGRHIAGEVFDAADLKGARDDHGRVVLEPIFVDLRQAWHRPSRAIQESFTQHTELLVEIFERLRSERNLAYLAPQVYREFREWKPLVEASGDELQPFELAANRRPSELTPEEFQEGFLLCNSVMQLMENVYLDLNLEQEWNHPDNRGWLNLFRHWSWSWMFRLSWAISASTFGGRFQKFCERRLHIPTGTVGGKPLDGPPYTEGDPKALNVLELHLAKRVEEACEPKSGDKLITLPLRLLVLEPGSAYLRDQGLASGKETEDELFGFSFGFAVLLEVAARRSRPAASYMVLLRIRDHLRKLGLARRGLRFLVENHKLLSGPPPLARNELGEVLPRYQEDRVRDMLLSVKAELQARASGASHRAADSR